MHLHRKTELQYQICRQVIVLCYTISRVQKVYGRQ